MAKISARRPVVPLADLAPKHELKGGGGQRVFGADIMKPASPVRRPPPKPVEGKRKKPA